ncbi:hypothetical protein BKA69DRAFT_1129211 [Paraphysoderma sedebokerense]|nr:hypothetical protein BKA69DRAFT_1129211 [Paraphysoderma sedebokerense]
MHLKTVAFTVLAVLGQFVRTQSAPPSQQCPKLEQFDIVNNPCNPILDKNGIDVSVEPVNNSSLYNPHIYIPDNDIDKWYFLRMDCSKRNGTPVSVRSMYTYEMSYIIAMVNCVLAPPDNGSTSLERSKQQIDIIFVNCSISLNSIPTYNGVIFQSSILPSSFNTGYNSKMVVLKPKAESLLDLTIANWMSNLVIVSNPTTPLMGRIHTSGKGGVGECSLGDSQMRIDLDSNFNVIQQCGFKSTLEILREGLESNLDIIILSTFCIAAVVISNLDSKQRAKPVASLFISLLSTYSALSRIVMAASDRYDKLHISEKIIYPSMFIPIFISICHTLYMTPKLCRRYNLPNNGITWILMSLGPHNIEILWSNFLGSSRFSHRNPDIQPEILGLLELHRSIAQDVGVTFLTEVIRTNISIGKMLRNCVTVFSLLHILRHWSVGRVYAKLGYFVLVIPVVLNIVLLFPGGLFYTYGYSIYMFCLSVYTSTLIGITKFTAKETRYAVLFLLAGLAYVVGVDSYAVQINRSLDAVRTEGSMFLMGLMAFICLITNIWHYRKVWRTYDEVEGIINPKTVMLSSK